MKKRFTHLLLLSLCTGSLFAQSPGGVGSPELWFQARPTGTDLNGTYRWQDFSGDSLRLNVYSDQGAAFGDEFTNSSVRYYNGNPALSLNKSLDTKTREVRLKRTNLSQATIVGVFAPNANFDKEMILYGLNGRPGQGVLVTTDKIIPSIESGKSKFDYGQSEGMDLMYSSNDSESNVNDFRVKSMRIAAYYRSIAPAKSVWGEKDIATLSLGSTYNKNNVNYNSTFSLSSAENRAFSGYIPELIAYNRLLTPIERRRVDSYLAIKYGLSLPVSYIGSDEQLLWDYAANPTYNNRITAIYRDKNSGLYQWESGTSYEELTNYSDQNDYFYNSNPYNRSSASRLLVLGRQDANPLKDTNYLFWGDNNDAIKIKEIEGKLGYKIMSRQWLVKTNIVATIPAERTLAWQQYDLVIATNGFKSSVTKSSTTTAQGVAYTAIPLADSDGYLGLSGFSISGNFYIKFGSNQSILSNGSNDYGYYITTSGSVYPIIQGVVSENSAVSVVLASKIEIEKRGNIVFLRVNGIRQAKTEILIADSDMNKPFYGAISMLKGSSDSKIGELCHGGFTDTGNKIELSYASTRAAEFKDNNKGRSFLVIDRSGSGSIDVNTAEVIEVDEVDITRQKAIFNNVFLNTGDEFTFMYRESDIGGEIEVTDPTCNLADGKIKIRLTSGNPAFNYTLTDVNTGQVVKSGKEFDYTIEINGLRGGIYDLAITETGGFNFQNIDATIKPTRAKTTNCLPVMDGALEWTISNLADSYMIGYTTFVEDVNNTKNIIHYGLKKQGANLYVVTNGKVATSVLSTVAVGDVVRIEKNMSGLKYKKNGTQIGTGSISWLDYLLKFYGLIDTSFGPAEILNVTATGFFNLADYNWTKMDNLTIGQSNNATLTYRVTLEDSCNGDPLGESQQTVQPQAESDNMNVFYKNAGDTKSVTARVTFAEPEVVTFTAYSMTGILIKKVDLPTPRVLQEADFDFTQAGVYIIKAITTNGEYSKKVMVK